MSICTGIGNGIGGALGKWGAGLTHALGLAAIVDLGTRAYTGYGLLETLNVPYIECPDGSFATAIEWYGSGLKCPTKKPQEPLSSDPNSPKNKQNKAANDYDDSIASLGGFTFTYWGASAVTDVTTNPRKTEYYSGNMDAGIDRTVVPIKIDKFGNVLNALSYRENIYDSVWVNGYYNQNFTQIITNSGMGGFIGSNYEGRYTRRYTTKEALRELNFRGPWKWSIIGVEAIVPSRREAPPAASIPPPQGFSPRRSPPPEECKMNCPCISPQEIKKAIKEVLGIAPFAPEKMIREIGGKMYAAPGPSVVPVIPKNLVEAIAALVAANYMRAGYGRYPVVMPDSLLASDNPTGDAVPTKAIENFAEWFEWHILQQDGIQGEWPIEIAIKDGLKKTPMKFENISEAIAEMTGLLAQTAADADTGVNAACTAAAIAQKAVNAATVAQKHVECVISFFGIRTGFKALFVQSAITPADPDDKNFNVRRFLSPSTQTLAVLTENDNCDPQATWDRILRNTEFARAAVTRSIDKDGLPGDYARNQRKYDAAEMRRDTEKAMEELETSIKSQNPNMQLKIKVNGSPSDVVVGDNFVIKRPKT